MPRTYFSPEVKQQAIALVLADHLTVAAAAQQVGCSVNALHNWLKKHRQEQCPGTPVLTFVPITLVDSAPTSIEIVTPNGFTIRLHSPLPLGDLLAVITSC
jgi:transposase-like protein